VIRAGAGVSAEHNTERAAHEAARDAMAQLNAGTAPEVPAGIAFVFATSAHLPRMDRLLQIVRDVTGAAQISGCTGHGVLGRGTELEAVPGVSLLVLGGRGLRATAFLEGSLRGNDAAVAGAIARGVRQSLPESGSSDAALLVVLPDAFNLRPDALLQGLEKGLNGSPRRGVEVVGGIAAEDGSQQKTYLFCNEKVETNAVAGALLSGPFAVETNLTQSCRPIGPLRRVTRAARNLIFELDGRPAFEVFAEAARSPLLQDLRRALSCLFIGMPLDPGTDRLHRGEYLVRNIVGLEPSAGVLMVAEPVPEGQPLGFVLRDADGAREDLKGMLDEVGASLASRALAPGAGFYFNCCARGRSLYSYPDIDSAYLQRSLGDLPLAGFFGNGEIGPRGGRTQLHGYSGVLTLLCEPAG
jgi:small ligand-binding sensory domain FIST